MSEKQAQVVLYSYIPFGPARFKLLVDYFGSAKAVWNTNRNKLESVGLKKEAVADFLKYRDTFNVKDYFNRLKNLSIEVVTKDDASYPQNLRELDDAPPVLYIKGKIKSQDTNAIAIVGSRRITAYGKEVTERFAQELARLGVTIVSGLAFGIDVEAHKSCLEAGGRCIAVLASGLDQITPRSNEWLGLKILKAGGALISEYPLGTTPQKSFFPFRNRIISGLSKAVLVIEGRQKSGTLHTASHAAKQGREVFAVPGQITSPMSEAPHFLIKSGAKIAFSVKDVLDELDLQLKIDREEVEKVLPSTKDEEKLLQILENEPLHLDEIARISTLEIKDISARLTMMEIKGLVKSLGSGVYKRT